MCSLSPRRQCNLRMCCFRAAAEMVRVIYINAKGDAAGDLGVCVSSRAARNCHGTELSAAMAKDLADVARWGSFGHKHDWVRYT